MQRVQHVPRAAISYSLPAADWSKLGMLAPTEWAQKDSLFQALEQWKFRPAAKNGQAVAVDVLLVIPRQEDE